MLNVMLQIAKDAHFGLRASGKYAGQPLHGLASDNPIFFN